MMTVTAARFTTDLDAGRLPLDASPLDPALTRAAMVHLISAYAAAHYRMPTARAVADVWAMLSGPSRPKMSAAAVRARGLAVDEHRPFGRISAPAARGAHNRSDAWHGR